MPYLLLGLLTLGTGLGIGLACPKRLGHNQRLAPPVSCHVFEFLLQDIALCRVADYWIRSLRATLGLCNSEPG